MAVDVMYTAHASVSCDEDGLPALATTDDENPDIILSAPKELGGDGDIGHNPEQLFAMGYSACFIRAMRMASSQGGPQVPRNVSVSTDLGVGPRSEGGFGLEVTLYISLPGVERSDAERLVEEAHKICPYSNATRGNIEVTSVIE